jgi:hypothetical protein
VEDWEDEWDLDDLWPLFEDLFSSSLLFFGDSWLEDFFPEELDDFEDEERLRESLLLVFSSLLFRGSRSSRSSRDVTVVVDDLLLLCFGILGKLLMLFIDGIVGSKGGPCSFALTLASFGGFRIFNKRGSRERADETKAADTGAIRTRPLLAEEWCWAAGF